LVTIINEVTININEADMSNLTLWGRLNSINVQKVLWLCEDISLPFHRIDAGMEFGVNKTEEYKSKNPNGLVPTIDDDGFILWESHSIMRYLARKYDATGAMYPQSLQDGAKVDQWLDWYNTVGWPPMRNLFWGWIRTPADKRNLQELETTRQSFIQIASMLDEQLGKTAYIAGNTFTMADIPIALLCYRWFNLPIERPTMKNLDAWYAKIQSRPGYQKYSTAPLT
jgi:glutathione S-transferase